MIHRDAFSALRGLLTAAPTRGTAAACELCGAPLSGAHGHVADTTTRRLLCACDRCAGTSTAAIRPVSGRYLHDGDMWITAEQWAALDVPVDLAFIFFNAPLSRWIVSYPGPAGAIESPLPIERWQTFADAHAWARKLSPDVEAVLVRRAGDAFQSFVIPIDRCYELVGRIRTSWSGLDGGDAVRREVDRFFRDLTARCGAAA